MRVCSSHDLYVSDARLRCLAVLAHNLRGSTTPPARFDLKPHEPMSPLTTTDADLDVAKQRDAVLLANTFSTSIMLPLDSSISLRTTSD